MNGILTFIKALVRNISIVAVMVIGFSILVIAFSVVVALIILAIGLFVTATIYYPSPLSFTADIVVTGGIAYVLTRKRVIKSFAEFWKQVRTNL